METHLYRYRSIKAALDEFHELERGEIYFSTPQELNDPMEGFKDLFWSGDQIVWRNLLKHYILCVLQATTYCLLAGADFDPKVLENIVFWVPEALPQAPIREVYERISKVFLAEPAVEAFIKSATSRKVPLRRNELAGHLRALHAFAVQIVLKDYRERGMLPPPLHATPSGDATPSPEELRANAIAMMESAGKLEPEKSPLWSMSEDLFAANEALIDQLDLVFEINLPDRDKSRPLSFLMRYFPRAYTSALDKLVHNDWYVACFARSPLNPAMWAMYGGGHRGICLKFKTPERDGRPTFFVNQITSVSGSEEGLKYGSSWVQHPLYEVVYSTNFPPIDFFRSLGSVSHQNLAKFWYRGENGTFSDCRSPIESDNVQWRESHWKTLRASALCKTPDWAHEEEYRLVLHSGFDLEKSEDRKLKYRFEDLAGIAFGARTSMEDKLKIMRIVDQRCAETHRTGFEFAEVHYSHARGDFYLAPLDLLKMDRNEALETALKDATT